MTEGAAHVLIHLLVLCVQDHRFWMVHVHEEAIFGQQLLLLDCGDAETRASGSLDLIRQKKNPKKPPTNGAITIFIWLEVLDDVVGVGQRGLLPLLLHQELHQVLRAHEARGFGVLSVDHVDLLPMGQQVVEMLDLVASQVPRFGLVAFLCRRQRIIGEKDCHVKTSFPGTHFG